MINAIARLGCLFMLVGIGLIVLAPIISAIIVFGAAAAGN